MGERSRRGVERCDWEGHGPLSCMTLLGSLERIGSNMRRHELLRAKRVCCLSDGEASSCRFQLSFREK